MVVYSIESEMHGHTNIKFIPMWLSIHPYYNVLSILEDKLEDRYWRPVQVKRCVSPSTALSPNCPTGQWERRNSETKRAAPGRPSHFQHRTPFPPAPSPVLQYTNSAESPYSMHVATQVGQLPCNLLTISSVLRDSNKMADM